MKSVWVADSTGHVLFRSGATAPESAAEPVTSVRIHLAGDTAERAVIFQVPFLVAGRLRGTRLGLDGTGA